MTTKADLMCQFAGYDEARQYYDSMLRDRRMCGDLNMEIRRIKSDFANDRVPLEDKVLVEYELDVFTRVKDRIEGRLYEGYQVNNVQELSDKIREFGPELERWFGQEVQSQSQQGQSQGGQQSTESVMMEKTKNAMEYSKFAELHIEQAERALETRNYELYQVESNKALCCMQEASRQIEYSQRLLRDEMERGGQTHQGNQHGNVLHPELQKVWGTEQARQLSYLEHLEATQRRLEAQRRLDAQQRGHSRDRDDGRDR